MLLSEKIDYDNVITLLMIEIMLITKRFAQKKLKLKRKLQQNMAWFTAGRFTYCNI